MLSRWAAAAVLILGAAPSLSVSQLVVPLDIPDSFSVSAKEREWNTPKHEAGRCAIRGHCGKQSLFGSELPCPDNEVAEEPSSDVREKLVKTCGDAWDTGPVCCTEEQIDALTSNLKKAENIISACPACKVNFFNLFCTFTCSANQSQFVNVTEVYPKGEKYLATEMDVLVSDEYGKVFYDSCKDVKMGATGGKAMDFIGGGAKNFTEFFKFLGDKRPFIGSPFQINFPRPNSSDFVDMVAMNDTAKKCNDSDERYRCACVDCPATCPELPAVSQDERCYVGLLPCLSFAVIVVYSALLLLLVTVVSAHVAYQKHTKHKNERLRLLQDSAPSDDEDEGDIIHGAGMPGQPVKHYWLNTMCDKAFSKLGFVCASFPAITMVSSILVVGLLSIGWIRFDIETNPGRLWVAPNSAAAQEKAFFDENFGPFFRAEQAFLTNASDVSGPAPVLSYDTLAWWFDVESRVQRLRSLENGVVLDDICFNPTGDACVVQSISGYFGGPKGRLSPASWQDKVKDCTESPVRCLPPFHQPLNPDLILGGWHEGVLDAEALVVTWVVNNHAEGTKEEKLAAEWESSLESLLQAVQSEAQHRGLRLSFNTEMSLEQELNKTTNTDAKIVVISYVVMFIYASLALGSTTLAFRTLLQNPSVAFVESKFMLGVVGIVIVLMSVSASVGLCSAAGVQVTLIIAEVIPFLVLAVGVDNIFLIVHEFERVNVSHPDGTVPERVAKALGRMGPSILLSATTETVAFALGAAVGMPAVRNFAIYAAGAVLINALLQVTMFVSALALNQQRVESGRADCLPCIKVKSGNDLSIGGVPYGMDEEGMLQRFIRKAYAPALLGKKMKVAVVTIFLALFAAGLGLLPAIELGLDQRIAIPTGSYLIDYFNDMEAYFNVGPPVYFVTRELNVTSRRPQQQLCGRFTTCNSFSVANVLEQERKRPEVSYITSSTASWIDDYFMWLNPELEDCCVDGSHTCFENRDPPWNVTLHGMPEGKEFIDYLKRWMQSPTNGDCPLGGQAPYSNAVVIDSERLTIPASHFRTSHTPLRNQADFINSYASARRIADDLSKQVDAAVFPYSKFYVFFDQYASIIQLAVALIGSALAIIFAITSLLLGSVLTGLAVTVAVAMTVVDIAGAMAVFNVSLNAVSLVNLVICVGIAVEFCAHIARAFAFPSRTILDRSPYQRYGHLNGHHNAANSNAGSGLSGGPLGRDARAWAALVNVAGSVFSGITITKLLGVVVLAFTRSKIFEVYYFRIWLMLVVFAALHALVFLPVLLSLVGGAGYIEPENDGGLEQDLRSRRYPALLDEEYDSDEY